MAKLYARKAEDGSCWLVLERADKLARWEAVFGMGATRAEAWADAKQRSNA